MRGGSRRTSRAIRALVVSLASLLVFAAPWAARADGRLQFLADRLKFPPAAGQPDDFRVRTNAALALGATDDDDAITPLCAGLADPSEVVRQAVAVAMRRLARPSSLGCLRKRLPLETSASVKTQLERAIDTVEASAGGAGAPSAAPYVPGAKYYVSISPVANNTARSTTEVEHRVREAISSKLGQLGDYQLAPRGESNDSAKAVMAKRKLKGFYLAVSVDKLDYSDGNLRVRMKLAVFSYPGKDLRGEVPAGATLPGAHPGDRVAEDELIALVAMRAAELFAQNFK
jgi:HEAT repeats